MPRTIQSPKAISGSFHFSPPRLVPRDSARLGVGGAGADGQPDRSRPQHERFSLRAIARVQGDFDALVRTPRWSDVQGLREESRSVVEPFQDSVPQRFRNGLFETDLDHAGRNSAAPGFVQPHLKPARFHGHFS